MGRLEALGFKLEVGFHGTRHCPVELADAVSEARGRGEPLASLVERDALRRFLARREDAADPLLAALVTAHAELSILRGVVGELERALGGDGHRSILSWQHLGLPDPRRGL